MSDYKRRDRYGRREYRSRSRERHFSNRSPSDHISGSYIDRERSSSRERRYRYYGGNHYHKDYKYYRSGEYKKYEYINRYDDEKPHRGSYKHRDHPSYNRRYYTKKYEEYDRKSSKYHGYYDSRQSCRTDEKELSVSQNTCDVVKDGCDKKSLEISMNTTEIVGSRQNTVDKLTLFKRDLEGYVQIRDFSNYEKLTQIGEGTYGKVYKAVCSCTGKLVALKKIRVEVEKEGFPITSTREIKLLSRLKHDNIVKLIEITTHKTHVYLVFEYMDFDLSGLISFLKPNGFTLSNIKYLSRELLKSILYLHENKILHRDIKGSNVLLNRQGYLKLADFGLAKCLDSHFNLNHFNNLFLTNRVITLWYRPPELLLGSSEYNEKVDIWSIGCLFIELFLKYPLFQGNNEITQLNSIYKISGTPSFYENEEDKANFPTLVNCPWVELLKPSVVYEPKLMDILRQDCNLSDSGVDFAMKLLSLDPGNRISAKEALNHEFFSEYPLSSSPEDLNIMEKDCHEYEIKLQRKINSQNISKTLLKEQN